ncbi:hypothetical protein [Nocardia yamanashiensis]|uniref:hypothetical protein n=1 Tax=Nocardia yamanashiensis TaxID=209247 RepID=UPI000835F593|nr:hypothetical protein [Nocardia yamanashiensis]
MAIGSDIEVVDTEGLRTRWSACWKTAAADRFVQVNWWGSRPTALLVSAGMWQERQKLDRALLVPDSRVHERTTSDARTQLTDVLDDLEAGVHTVLLFHGKAKAVVVPYVWARQAFPELMLAVPADPLHTDVAWDGELALVLNRSPRAARRFELEFAGAADPDFEADRVLLSSSSVQARRRQAAVRVVVYVVDGRIERVRAVDPGGEWVDRGDGYALAPVSAALTREEIDARFPGLGLYPGDARPAAPGQAREYIDL